MLDALEAHIESEEVLGIDIGEGRSMLEFLARRPRVARIRSEGTCGGVGACPAGRIPRGQEGLMYPGRARTSIRVRPTLRVMRGHFRHVAFGLKPWMEVGVPDALPPETWLRIATDGSIRRITFPDRFDPFRFTSERVWGAELDAASIAWIDLPTGGDDPTGGPP